MLYQCTLPLLYDREIHFIIRQRLAILDKNCALNGAINGHTPSRGSSADETNLPMCRRCGVVAWSRDHFLTQQSRWYHRPLTDTRSSPATHDGAQLRHSNERPLGGKIVKLLNKPRVGHSYTWVRVFLTQSNRTIHIHRQGYAPWQ